MDVTLPVDAGDEERVLLVPRHEGEFAKVGTIAEVTDRVRLPGGGRAVVPLRRRPRRRRRRPHRPRAAACASRSTEHPDDVPVDGRTRDAEREYRAVVEEILELRGDDGRVARVPARDRRARRAGRHDRLRARRLLRAEGRGARDARRDRAARAGRPDPARAPDRAAGPPADPRGRPVRRREAAARVLPAQADGVDPARARRGRRLGRRGVPHEDRRGRHARGGARAGRRRSSAGSSAWASSRARPR